MIQIRPHASETQDIESDLLQLCLQDTLACVGQLAFQITRERWAAHINVFRTSMDESDR
jgi:hypothetical protein